MKALIVVLFVALIVVLCIYGPFITIWALNALFGLTIADTWLNWFYVVWLTAIVSGNTKIQSKRD